MNLCIDSKILFEAEKDETVEEAVNRFQRLVKDLGLKLVIMSVKEEEIQTCEIQSSIETPQPEKQ